MKNSLANLGTGLRRPMARTRNQLTNLWGNMVNRKSASAPEDFLTGDRWPSLDLSENDKEVLVKVEAPGLSEEDLEISYADGALIIKGEKKEDKEEKRRDIYYRESRHGAFMRSVPIDANVEWDKAKAEFKRGVLKVALPKKNGRGRKKEIPVS